MDMGKVSDAAQLKSKQPHFPQHYQRRRTYLYLRRFHAFTTQGVSDTKQTNHGLKGTAP
jgi:hypothetical protein